MAKKVGIHDSEDLCVAHLQVRGSVTIVEDVEPAGHSTNFMWLSSISSQSSN